MMHGPEKSDPAIVADEAGEQSGTACCGAICSGAETQRSRWSEGRGPRGMRASKARAGHRAGQACHRRWNAYGKSQEKRRRRGSPRSSTTSASICLGKAFSELKKRRRSRAWIGLTWTDYEADLERNLDGFCMIGSIGERIGHCRAGESTFPSRMDGSVRSRLPPWRTRSSNGRWLALLNAIYEEDFLGFSYGFRPGRGTHDALDALCVGIHSKKVSYILDADIRSFFDEISQEWLIRFSGAPDRRPAHHPPDPEMVEGGRPRRRGRERQ